MFITTVSLSSEQDSRFSSFNLRVGFHGIPFPSVFLLVIFGVALLVLAANLYRPGFDPSRNMKYAFSTASLGISRGKASLAAGQSFRKDTANP